MAAQVPAPPAPNQVLDVVRLDPAALLALQNPFPRFMAAQVPAPPAPNQVLDVVNIAPASAVPAPV